MKLDKLKKGQTGKVVAVRCGQKTKNRLTKMGLTEGARVEFIRTSPLGDPLEIKVRDFYLAIRKNAAENIEVLAENIELLAGGFSKAEKNRKEKEDKVCSSRL